MKQKRREAGWDARKVRVEQNSGRGRGRITRKDRGHVQQRPKACCKRKKRKENGVRQWRIWIRFQGWERVVTARGRGVPSRQ